MYNIPGQGQTSENTMVSSKLNSTYIPKPAGLKLIHLPEAGEEQNKTVVLEDC